MAYIGKEPAYGSYSKLDPFTFNGVTTAFNCFVAGNLVTPGSAQNILVSLDGVIQNPITDYNVSLNAIVFVVAPGVSQSCFVILLGDVMAIGTPSDNTVSTVKIIDGAVTDVKISGLISVAKGGTGVGTSTGTGSVVLSDSPTLVTPALGTPGSGVMTNMTGLPLATGVTGTLLIANGGTGSTSQIDALATLGAAALTTNTFTGTQIISDQQLSRAMLVDVGHTFLDKGNSSTTTQTLDFTAGSHQKVTATGNHTYAFSNWPPTGNTGFLMFEMTNYGAFTITHPTVNWSLPAGGFTTSFSTYMTAVAAAGGAATLQSSGTNFIVYWTRDAGTTVYGKLVS